VVVLVMALLSFADSTPGA